MTSRTSESELQRRVTEYMGSGEGIRPEASTDEDFNTLALDVFAHQYEHIEAVHRFAEITGRIPGSVAHWREIPLLPRACLQAVFPVCRERPRAYISLQWDQRRGAFRGSLFPRRA